MYSLARLITKNFFRRMYEPIMAFGLPVLIYLILRYVISSSTTDYVWMNYLLAGMSLYIPMVLGLMVMPAQIMQFKESVLIKRIGVTPINPRLLTLSFLLSYFVLSILATTVLFSFVTIVEAGSETFNTDGTREIINSKSAVAALGSIAEDVGKAKGIISQGIETLPPTTPISAITGVQLAGLNNALDSIGKNASPTIGSFNRDVYIMTGADNIFMFLTFMLMANMISLTCGLAIASLSKSLPIASAIGSALFFPAMFLTGMYFPLSTESAGGYIAWLFPWRSVFVLVFLVWFTPMISQGIATGGAVESAQFKGFSDTFIGTSSGIGESYHTWLAIGIVVLYLSVFSVIFFTKFKWSKIR